MQFKGTVTNVSAIHSGTSKSSGKAWQRQDVVLTYDSSKPEWPKTIKFSVMGDKIKEFNFVQGGEYEVEVDFSVRPYQDKLYMDANCWKATALNQQPAPQVNDPFAAMGMQPKQVQPQPAGDGDPLPF
ncbi:MAG: DUF3127 domain-containing protein [Lachnospiraceae bacterium]|nr:DUF3127 domain-containing protein [Lachnospiraceae bacterium]